MAARHRYDGTKFSGWAAQAGQRTVQGELEPGSREFCAGRAGTPRLRRTADAAVHARGQVAHVDLGPTVITDGGDALTRRLNKVLGGDCVVHRISAAPRGFDARFAAIWRRYVYRLSDAGVRPDPLYRYQIAQVTPKVDLARLNGRRWPARSTDCRRLLSSRDGLARSGLPRADWSALPSGPMAVYRVHRTR